MFFRFFVFFRKCQYLDERKMVKFPPSVLSFSYKLFFALGAGDGDLAFALGNTGLLTASGAAEILMAAILAAAAPCQESAVFLIPLVGVAGQTAENGIAHAHIAQGSHRQTHPEEGHQQRNQAKNQTCAQNSGIEFVRAVSAGHKSTEETATIATHSATS